MALAFRTLHPRIVLPEVSMPSIKERLERARQKDFITVAECALLVGVSERTVWRRLPDLATVVRSGRITRVHRVSAVRYFLNLRQHEPPAAH